MAEEGNDHQPKIADVFTKYDKKALDLKPIKNGFVKSACIIINAILKK
jgi:hypothetical protein